MRLLVIIAKSDAQTSFICSELSCLLMLVPQLLVTRNDDLCAPDDASIARH